MIQNIWWPQKYYFFFLIQQLIKKKKNVYQNYVFAFTHKKYEGR